MGLSQGKFIVNHEDKEAVKVEANGEVTQEVKDVSINIKENTEIDTEKSVVKEKCKKKKDIRIWVKKRFSDRKDKKSPAKGKDTPKKEESKKEEEEAVKAIETITEEKTEEEIKKVVEEAVDNNCDKKEQVPVVESKEEEVNKDTDAKKEEETTKEE